MSERFDRVVGWQLHLTGASGAERATVKGRRDKRWLDPSQVGGYAGLPWKHRFTPRKK